MINGFSDYILFYFQMVSIESNHSSVTALRFVLMLLAILSAQLGKHKRPALNLKKNLFKIGITMNFHETSKCFSYFASLNEIIVHLYVILWCICIY